MGNFLDDYQPVEDRLRDFWERHPAGRVTTELLSFDNGRYIVQASLWRGDELREGRAAATGLASDSIDTLPANMKASALEVCETSAIGRALANLGFAPKGKRPSREEMAKVSPSPGVGARPAESPPRSTPGDLSSGAVGVGGSPPADPDTTASEGVPDDNGEGSDGTPSLVSFEGLAKAVGGVGKARELINSTVGSEYTARTVLSATEAELHAAMAAHVEQQLVKDGAQ